MNTPTINRKKLAAIHHALLQWYKRHRRQFHWRNTNDPYKILVSEVMLQQTQSGRVQEKMPAFIEIFPDIETLARSTKSEVIRAWKGMGYNNRAIRLRDLAQKVLHEYRGVIPNEPESLKTLPGIGPYTAHAVACFAFRKRVPVVDVNVRRTLSRLFSTVASHAETLSENECWRFAEQVLPRDAYSWNQALMELGSRICKARVTLCTSCPVRTYCVSVHLSDVPRTTTGAGSLKKEKMYHGIPVRLWRGKIVSLLRQLEQAERISLNKLGSALKEDFSKIEVQWLESVISQLQNDGIVESKKRGAHLMIRLAD